MTDDFDPFGSDSEDFNPFGDEEEGFGDFDDLELGDEEDVPEFGEEEPTGAGEATLFGLNRNFVLIGGVIALVICVAIGGLLLVILSNQGPTDVDLTVTSVLATNTAVRVALDLTETRNAITNTPTPTFTPTATFTPTNTATPTEAPPTPTQAVIFVTPTGGQGGGGISQDAIAQTATALAAILGGGSPTPEVGGGFVTPTPAVGGPVATALPTTGLFDEIGTDGGVNGLATAGLAALGLAAVIVAARRLRKR